MRCPFCGKQATKVIDSRSTKEGGIRRRRECSHCGRRFTTYERVEEIKLWVRKKDGRREVFDRNKILSGLQKACEKRPIPMNVLENLVDEVEKELRNRMEGEVSSSDIGELVISKLKKIDEVAYVRFASVYRQFQDLGTFLSELRKIMRDNAKK
ncbi:MAG: transcriptional regulator NrdR [Caldiserica bacterium]|nr:transcriptional regulator NrdR [Caldisericota bacterium]MDH7562985.1 transcriptional regulator NrdR [Caldisericota bacterium]